MSNRDQNHALVAPLSPIRLRCEGLENPQAVQLYPPRLDWNVVGAGRGRRQTAYRLVAASTREALCAGDHDLWDSGKVVSAETLAIPYAGRELAAGAPCWWAVAVWDEADRLSALSEPACFGRGLAPEDWVSEWIGYDRTRELDLPPAPFDGANWIRATPPDASPARAAVFVGVLTLPTDLEIEHSEVAFATAGKCEFYWGGEKFGMNEGGADSWRRPYIRHMNDRLGPGANRFLFHIEADADTSPVLLFKAVVWTRDGRIFQLVSDGNWFALEASGIEWRLPDSPVRIVEMAERREARAVVVGAYGDAPWGLIRGSADFLPPAACLRREFVVKKPIRRAVLHATALGWYDLLLNGRRVNETYFDPGWTDYAKRLYHRAYDVTAFLAPGANAWAVTLADGWFSGYIGWMNQRDLYGKNPRFRGQLRVEYADGEMEIIASDRLWRAAFGPIREADILRGETYDARLEHPGWDRAGFDDSAWENVSLGTSLRPLIEAHPGHPVVALRDEAFAPVAITEPAPGVFVFDLGQNFTGVVELKLRGCRRGTRIRIRHGERLRADGTLYTENLRTARATDTYFCRGDAEEIWSPRFTFHGFQYVEITGLASVPSADTVTGLPLSTGAPRAAKFRTSDPLVDRLSKNVYWSMRSNFIEVPTDCPQRDERLGWLDGPYTFVYASAYWADVRPFFNKFNTDMGDAQLDDGRYPWVVPRVVACLEHNGPFWAGSGPAWMDAGIICPWAVYWFYGDERQLARHYPAMCRLIDYYLATSRDLLPPEEHRCLGDWLNQGGKIPLDVFRTAYFARSADILARIARTLGLPDDAARYAELFQDIRRAFQRAYVSPSGLIQGDVQGCYALALEFDLLDGERLRFAETRLVEKLRENDGRLTTGLEVTLPLMRSLSRMGRSDLAYALLHEERYPSWNYTIKNGATTIWERWDSWTAERGFGDVYMNSFNHFTLGSVFQWMMENIGGIQPLEAGFKRIQIAPQPGGKLTEADIAYESVRGRIACRWKIEAGALTLAVSIPANAEAELVLPGDASAAWSESSGACVIERSADGARSVALESGEYIFLCEQWSAFAPALTPGVGQLIEAR